APLHRRPAPPVDGCEPQRREQAVRQDLCTDRPGHQHRADPGAGRQAVRPVLIGLHPIERTAAPATQRPPQNERKVPMSVNYGSKRVVVGAHYGLRDWLSQRVTAVLMALFTLALLVQVIFSTGPIGYDKWAGIFSAQWMKVLTFSVIIALAWHAWVGLREILMDYIKPVGLRLALQVFSIVWLVGCAGWGIQVLWRL